MKNFLFTLLAGVLLCGCSAPPLSQVPEPTATETILPTPTWTSTSEPTDTMTPTATPTPVPLSEIDWNAIIYQGGDLPEMFVVTELPGSSVSLGAGDLAPDYIEGLDFRIPGTDDGINVTLGIYDSADTAREEYILLSTGAEPTMAFGDQAITSTNIINDEDFGMILMSHLTFLRCNAVVNMVMVTFDYSEQTWSDPSILAGYAEKLDARLSEAACR